MGKSSINGTFSMAMLNNQRVYIYIIMYKPPASNVWPSLFFPVLTPLEFGTLFLWAASGASDEWNESGVMIEPTRILDECGLVEGNRVETYFVLQSKTAMYWNVLPKSLQPFWGLRNWVAFFQPGCWTSWSQGFWGVDQPASESQPISYNLHSFKDGPWNF